MVLHGDYMLEQMLAIDSKPLAPGIPGAPVSGFNYATNASTGTISITSNHTQASLISPPVELPGYAKVLNVGPSVVGFTGLSGFNVGTGDYTLDIRVLYTGPGGNVYFFQAATSAGNAIRILLGDSGFGNRLQISMLPNQVSNCYSANVLWTDLRRWRLVTMQRRAGKISMYVDGVKQLLAVGTSTSYLEYEYNATRNMDPVSNASIGNGGNASGTYIGEFAFYQFAKYDSNFEPIDGYLV